MNMPPAADFSAAETLRNDLLEQPLAAALLGAIGRTIRVQLAQTDPREWKICEVHPEWFRAETTAGATVFAQLSQIDWLALDAGALGPLPDPVAPRFRGVLSELARRRESVRVVTARVEADGLLHHVGADYLQLSPSRGEAMLLPLSTIAWVELSRTQP